MGNSTEQGWKIHDCQWGREAEEEIRGNMLLTDESCWIDGACSCSFPFTATEEPTRLQPKGKQKTQVKHQQKHSDVGTITDTKQQRTPWKFWIVAS